MIISDELKRRYRAFWNREKTDRACIYITAWTGGPGYRGPSSLEEQWCGLDYRINATTYNNTKISYFLEGFPSATVNFGPGSLAAGITGYYKLAPQTVWFETDPPFISDWDNMPEIAFHPEYDLMEKADRFGDMLLEHKDELVAGITDIGGTYDIIASLRGTNNLLYDMYDYPDEVKALREKIAPIWAEYFKAQTDKLFSAQGCMSSWIPIWSDQPYYTLQCDYSAMISPAMFEEFILPDLKAQTELMPRSLYHLDGPDEIRHLDLLLSLPRLNAIQWVSGSGQPLSSDECWFDMFRRIQKAGKGLIINEWVTGQNLEKLLRNVSQRGLYFMTGARDLQEANEIAAMAVRLGEEYERTHAE